MFKSKKLKAPLSDSSVAPASDPTHPTTEPTDDREPVSHQFVIWTSVAVIASAFLIFVVFLGSGARDNIIASNQARLTAPVVADATTPEPVPETTTPTTDEPVAPETDVADTDDVTSESLAEQLDSMSSDEVLALADTLEAVIKKNPERFERSASEVGALTQDGMTLAEAYAEAERRYPDKVDASKRLKLVADLGSGAYWYYVAEQGDTLIGLSEAFNVPLGQLVELNGMRDADRLPAGMIILLPDEAFVPADRQVDK